ncbi:unnamed protein product [Brassica rapa subsp. trilocularis]
MGLYFFNNNIKTMFACTRTIYNVYMCTLEIYCIQNKLCTHVHE